MPSTLPNAASSQLKSQRAYRQVLHWIRGGQLSAGERLPPEREIAGLLGINHLTVRRGLAQLVTEGVIVKRRNVGNFVVEGGQNASLALVIPSYLHADVGGHPWTGCVLSGACSSLDPMRHSLSTLYYSSDRLWDDVGRALTNAGVRGILLVPDSSVTADQVRQLLAREIRVVSLHGSPQLAVLSLPTVQPDHAMALVQLVHGLHERGHRRVRVAAYTSNPMRHTLLTTLRIALEQTAIGDPDEVLLDLPNARDVPLKQSYRVFEEALEANVRPTAIVVPDEFAAAELFQTCYRMGIRVPDDLSIAALSDLTPHAHAVPLTAPDSVTVARLTGQIAASRLTAQLQNDDTQQGQTLLRNDVIWRTSVATLHRRDQRITSEGRS